MKLIKQLIVYPIFFLTLSACDAHMRVSGKVVDENGAPVEGAKVWLIFVNWVSDSVTDKNGEFFNARTHGGNQNVSLLVSKEGKQLYYESLDSDKAKVNKTIVLIKGKQDMLNTPEHKP
ncbi:carboxypeptidase-like regulatory domain-containing protein [Undibacterium sp. JH2W]|uniref:carboxypeptidase-like regulatory domain-containing protein n=1 Tax=Undibacterium sp. JH2W TaxID=3413037 RepID=UPI003BF06149